MGEAIPDRAPAEVVTQVHQESRGTYGSPRVHAELRARGQCVYCFNLTRSFIVHRAQHNGTFALLRERPETAAQVYEFLRSGKTEGLPARSELPPVAFARPNFPAPPPR